MAWCAGADPNVEDGNGATPLLNAGTRGHFGPAKALIAAGSEDNVHCIVFQQHVKGLIVLHSLLHATQKLFLHFNVVCAQGRKSIRKTTLVGLLYMLLPMIAQALKHWRS